MVVVVLLYRILCLAAVVAVFISAWEIPTTPVRRLSRRTAILVATTAAVGGTATIVGARSAVAADIVQEKSFIQEYDDFIKTDAGWSYRDVTPGTSSTVGGEKAVTGDRVVFDWSGYTIGYFGRPFQAKGGPQGGAFDKDLDYERAVLGKGKYVRGLEQAMTGMSPGQIRQIVIPYGEFSYPESDLAHDVVGPKPSTFSGQRALNFVLQNPRIDRTLLFNVKVIRVDKPDGKGGFKRGGGGVGGSKMDIAQ
jgi:FKBP-type peptidyl-prolyl cis-trans isomerase